MCDSGFGVCAVYAPVDPYQPGTPVSAAGILLE